jgi:hypothetical protein
MYKGSARDELLLQRYVVDLRLHSTQFARVSPTLVAGAAVFFACQEVGCVVCAVMVLCVLLWCCVCCCVVCSLFVLFFCLLCSLFDCSFFDCSFSSFACHAHLNWSITSDVIAVRFLLFLLFSFHIRLTHR